MKSQTPFAPPAPADPPALSAWGLDPFFSAQLDAAPAELLLARVVRQQGRHYRVVTATGERDAQLAGRLDVVPDPGPLDRAELPAVGDWVGLDADAPERIRRCLRRRSAFLRRAAGRAERPQVVAANVDRVLIVVGLDADYNPSRVERYLAAIWDSGASPTLVLSKADLAASGDAEARRAEIESLSMGVPVRLVSAHGDPGISELAADLAPGHTVALVGSSGVGKSTLVNALLGDTRMHVDDVRARDGRGQHTTTHRELVRLPSGALLIDTPGMRELALWVTADGAGEVAAEVFADVEDFAASCRYRDCTHADEPECAVRAAIAAGTLDERRLASYRKLLAEEAFARRKQDKSLALAHARSWKRVAREHRLRTQRNPKS